jgi:hypothetical protein
VTTFSQLTDATAKSLRSTAFALARRSAAVRGQRLVAAFDDTLSGDIARFHLLRMLRRRFPELPARRIAALIEEDFTP